MKPTAAVLPLVLLVCCCCCSAGHPAQHTRSDADCSHQHGQFDWIQRIANGVAGQKYTLEAKVYLIDKQYQLPRGTELWGAGTAPGHRTAAAARVTAGCCRASVMIDAARSLRLRRHRRSQAVAQPRLALARAV